jgi:hypothetical protein
MQWWYSTNAYWIAFAIFIAISIPTGLAISGYQYNAVYKGYATQQAYAEAENKFYDECFSIGSVEKFRSCIADAAKSAREPQRSEEDVAAQKEMALWAKWMLIVSAALGVLTFSATVVGAVFVWRSIRDTREHFAADQRPWLRLSRPVIHVMPSDPNQISFAISAKNIGKTPAMGVAVHIEASRAKIPMENVSGVEKFARKFVTMPVWPTDKKIIFPNRKRDLVPMDNHVSGEARGIIRVLYCVTYRGGATDKVLHTAGEVIFNPSRIDHMSGDENDIFEIASFQYYGASFAS